MKNRKTSLALVTLMVLAMLIPLTPIVVAQGEVGADTKDLCVSKVFYGWAPACAGLWGCDTKRWIHVIGLEDNTLVNLWNITGTPKIQDWAIVNRRGVKEWSGAAEVPEYFKIVANKPVVATVYAGVEIPTRSYATFYPAVDTGSFVGKDFIFEAYRGTATDPSWGGAYNASIIACEAATVNIYDATDTLLSTFSLLANKTKKYNFATLTVYHVNSTGNIMIRQSPMEDLTMSPSTSGNFVGKTHYGSCPGGWGIWVIAHEPGTVKVYNLTVAGAGVFATAQTSGYTVNHTFTKAGEFWKINGSVTGGFDFLTMSTGNVSVFSGFHADWGVLGDTGYIGGKYNATHAEYWVWGANVTAWTWGKITIIAHNDTRVTVNGTAYPLKANEHITINSKDWEGAIYHVVSNRSVIIIDHHGIAHYGSYLSSPSGIPAPPVITWERAPTAIIKEDKTWCYLGETIHLWSESLDAANATHIPLLITREDWNITDSYKTKVFTASLGRHSSIDWTPTLADIYTVNLTVYAIYPGLAPKNQSHSTTATKTVSEKPPPEYPATVPPGVYTVFYGFAPACGGEWECDTKRWLHVVGLEDGTTVYLIDITKKPSRGVATATVNRMEVIRWDGDTSVVPEYFKIYATKPVAVTVFAGHDVPARSYATFYPTVDGSFVGKDFIFEAYKGTSTNTGWGGAFNASIFACEDATVNIYNATHLLSTFSLLANKTKKYNFATLKVYHVNSTGNIMIRQSPMEGLTLSPSTSGNFVGKTHYGSVGTSWGIWAVAYEPGTITVYNLTVAGGIFNTSLASGYTVNHTFTKAGEFWNITGSITGGFDFYTVSTGNVSVGSGYMASWGTLGYPGYIGGKYNATAAEYWVWGSQTWGWGNITIFAHEDTALTINGTAYTLKADEHITLMPPGFPDNPPGPIYHIVSNRNVTINDHHGGAGHWGSYLPFPSVVTVPLEIDAAVDIVTTFCPPRGNPGGKPRPPLKPVTDAFETWTVKVNITARNLGNTPQTFTVKAYYGNATGNYTIGVPVSVTLGRGGWPGYTTTKTFTWAVPKPAKVYPYWTYTIYGEATLAGDMNATNNVCASNVVKVRWLGDATGGGKVNIYDLTKLAKSWKKAKTSPEYNPMCDFGTSAGVEDGEINVFDLTKLALNWKKGPVPETAPGPG